MIEIHVKKRNKFYTSKQLLSATEGNSQFSFTLFIKQASSVFSKDTIRANQSTPKKSGYNKCNSYQEADFIVNLKHFNLAEISSAQLHDVVYLLNDEIIYCTVHVYLS